MSLFPSTNHFSVSNTSSTNPLLQSICWQPTRYRKSPSCATHALFYCWVFSLCSNTRLTEPETRHRARRADAHRETEVWRVPGCSALFMVEPSSDVRSVEEQNSLYGQTSKNYYWRLDCHPKGSQGDSFLLYSNGHGLSYNYLENVFN